MPGHIAETREGPGLRGWGSPRMTQLHAAQPAGEGTTQGLLMCPLLSQQRISLKTICALLRRGAGPELQLGSRRIPMGGAPTAPGRTCPQPQHPQHPGIPRCPERPTR